MLKAKPFVYIRYRAALRSGAAWLGLGWVEALGVEDVLGVEDTPPSGLQRLHYHGASFQNADRFDPDVVLNQLRYSGMLETVKIRRAGFPVRRTFQDFYNR